MTYSNSKSRRYLRWLVFGSSTYELYAFVASILAALISSLIWNRNKVLFRICLLFPLLFLPVPSLAQGVSGYVEAKGFAFAERASGSDPWAIGWGTLFAKWEQKVDEAQLTASLRGEGITSDERGPLAFDPADRKLRRSPISVRDFWLRYPLTPSVDLQMGRFQLGWGKTDIYSPADAFLPRDWSEPYTDEKIPIWALSLTGQNEGFRYEAVVNPVTTPWRLPAFGGQTSPLNKQGAPPGTSYREVESTPPTLGFAALRLQYTFGDWDLGAWGRVGVRPAPLLDFRINQATATPSGLSIPVERRYAREEAAGLELSRIAGSWIIRAEGAVFFSRERDLGDALIGALGAEKGFGDGTLYITLAGNALSTPVDSRLLFDRSNLPLFSTMWTRTEEWGDWSLLWNVGLKHGDGLFKGEINYNITDTTKLTFGVDLPHGSDKGPFGLLNDARLMHVALRQSW